MHRSPSAHRRTKRALIGGLVLVTLLLLFRAPMQRAFTAQVVFRTATPSPDVMKRMVARSSDPIVMIERLWNVPRIPHRQFAIRQMRRAVDRDESVWQRIRPMALEALHDVDQDVQTAAVRLFQMHDDGHALQWAAARLDHADPELRYVWLNYVIRVGDEWWNARLVDAVDDHDAHVRTIAAATLRNRTDLDYGVRIDSDQASVRTAAAAWRQWRSGHDGAAGIEIESAPSPAPRQLIPVSIKLPNLAGQTVDLRDYRGRWVLINFWATWCAPCIAETPDLVQLQDRMGDRLSILGISTDLMDDGHGHSGGGQADRLAKIHRFVETYGINYEILLERKGRITAAYNAVQLPTHILIDSHGHIAARWVGARDVDVFEAIIRDLQAAAQ